MMIKVYKNFPTKKFKKIFSHYKEVNVVDRNYWLGMLKNLTICNSEDGKSYRLWVTEGRDVLNYYPLYHHTDINKIKQIISYIDKEEPAMYDCVIGRFNKEQRETKYDRK